MLYLCFIYTFHYCQLQDLNKTISYYTPASANIVCVSLSSKEGFGAKNEERDLNNA